MAQALYRKYRPTLFADVTGQAHVKQTIQNQIASNKVAHAYLFSGPRGIGKTTIARLLAKTVNCQASKNGEPCNQCQHCQSFAEGKAFDILEIDAASQTGVDNVRENIIEAVRFGPNNGKFKVFIIDEVHMLSMYAFNALLKTLEEPPAYAIFILATTDVHKIPATIISRCQRFDFHKIKSEDLKARLRMITTAENVEVADEVFDSIIRISEGCVRDAESLLGQILALGEKSISIEEASLVLPATYIAVVKDITSAIIAFDARKAIALINEFIEQGGQIKPFFHEMIEYVRELMMAEINQGGSSPASPLSSQQGGQLAVGRYARLIDKLLEVRQKQAPEAFPQLPFEIMVIDYCERGQESGTRNQESKNDDDQDPPQVSDELEIEDKQNNPPPMTVRATVGVQKECLAAVPVPPELQRSEGGFSVEDLKSKWKRCCEVVSRTNIALPLVLQKAEPIGIYGDKVHIGFRQSFHFEMMSQRKNLDILASAINEIMNCKIDVMPVFEQDETEKVVGDLAEAFGGVIVE